MSPLEFMQRLAALVPRPRLHLIRFHGVLAPNAKLRPLVVPRGPEVQAQATKVAVTDQCEAEMVQARPHRISWARLLKRVFDIDMQHCPNCGAGELKIIAAILERPVIEKILTHLGPDPQPPPRGRAREAGHDVAARAASAVDATRQRPHSYAAAGVAQRPVSVRHASHQGQPWDPRSKQAKAATCERSQDLPRRRPCQSRSPAARTSAASRPSLEPLLGLAKGV
ncbi:MAG: transposase [Rubrivivax sp.]|nr:transposase [Rubrivivax sp.]